MNNDVVRWICKFKVEKRWGDDLAAEPYEVIEGDGNLLMTNGANILWTKLTGGAGTVYDSTNGYIGVGDSTTAEAASQTDLQAATNKLRKQVTGAPTVSTNTCQFVTTFATGDANFAWQEWAVFNASTAGTMLNRKVVSLGTKTSAASWTFTVTLSLA